MILYPASIEQVINFDIIQKYLKQNCQTQLGHQWVDNIRCTPNLNNISQQLTITWECVLLIRSKSISLPQLHDVDVNSSLKRLLLEGSFLDEKELYDIRIILQSFIELTLCLTSLDADIFPLLHSFFNDDISVAQEAEHIISSVISTTGELREDASSLLQTLHHDELRTQKQIERTLHAILEKAKIYEITEQDAQITIRDGRFAIPVPAGNKRKIKGAVIDESDTGKTSFIEPNEIIETNNALRTIQLQIRRERLRILKEVTSRLSQYVNILNQALNKISQFDFILSKAKLALFLNAHLPTLTNSSIIQWYKVYSPILLINGVETIPFDITLPDHKMRILIISGPNAGGKSVALKTIILNQYMLQCGILPTISEDSICGIFDKIIVDIGDDQSIENDISTYAAHLLKHKEILSHASNGLLFGIDEVGSGTEPTMGEAIAKTILTQVASTQAIGIVTTHFTNIKMLATYHPHFKNAAMLFNNQTLKPLYQMQFGHPGNSFAFEIAKNMGIPPLLLDEAKKLIGSEKINYESLIDEIRTERKQLSDKSNELQLQQSQLAQLIKHYQTLITEQKNKKQTIIEEAYKKAESLLSECNATIEKTIKEIRETQADKEKTKMARQKISKLKEKVEEEKSPEKDNKIKILHDFSELLPNKHTNRKTTGISVAATIRNHQKNFIPTIDLRGMKADEALQCFMTYLDEAIMVSAKYLTIIHGTGTGAVKTIIRDYLKQVNNIRTRNKRNPLFYGDGDPDRGGAGVTIVQLQ